MSNRGLDVSPAEFGEQVTEWHRAHSTALHASLTWPDGTERRYRTGPAARWANTRTMP